MAEAARGSHTPAFRARALDLILIACFAGMLALAERTGRSGRVVLARERIVRCDSPKDALIEWRRAGVRGRILVHLARHISADPAPGPLSDENYLYQAIRENIVRRIYHVIPEADWPEVESHLHANPAAELSGGTFRVQIEGAPVIVLRLADLPDPGEPVLVDLDSDRFTTEQLTQVAGRLARATPRSDLVAWQGSHVPFQFEALGARSE